MDAVDPLPFQQNLIFPRKFPGIGFICGIRLRQYFSKGACLLQTSAVDSNSVGSIGGINAGPYPE
jgi:hypothetical protein